MAVKEVAGKWYTVSKSGKVGKRGFISEANALAAQTRGRALLASSGGGQSIPSSAQSSPPVLSTDTDTEAERKALGIPPKRAKADPEGF